jgi:hypothetical protein
MEIELSAEQAARFWARVDRTGACWEWQGARDRRSYGKVGFGRPRRCLRAHRIAWTLTHGPIPAGLHVLHDCPDGDNPACCNPAHLWLGTDADNVADMVDKGRQARGERGGRARLTTEQIRAIRQTYGKDHNLQKLARAHDVSVATVWHVVQRRTWRHVA